MTSRKFRQFLGPPPPSVTHLCPRPYALLSQNAFPLFACIVKIDDNDKSQDYQDYIDKELL